MVAGVVGAWPFVEDGCWCGRFVGRTSLRGLLEVGEGVVKEIAIVIDHGGESDARWFIDHPDREVRIRPQVAGEFGPLADERGTELVDVRQLGSGVRVRSPLPMVGRSA